MSTSALDRLKSLRASHTAKTAKTDETQAAGGFGSFVSFAGELRGKFDPSEIPATPTAKTDDSLTQATRPGDALLELYREWLVDAKEGSFLLTLSPEQVGVAVAVGAVSEEVARASVLLVVRSPLGAAGLMHTPKAKYDAFAIIRAMESPPCIH